MPKLKSEVATEKRTEGDADVIIVGAGVGGSALAYALAKDGRRVHVIERDMREPERMMGEVMQPGGRFMLAKLGLQDCLEGIEAQKTTGLAVYKDGKEGVLPFPVEYNNFPYEPSARSFHNGRFVQRLRQMASSLPNVHMEEGTVKSFIEEKGVIRGVIYKNNVCQETMAFAPLTVVCDGCYSNLRRSLVDSAEDVHTYMVGYITKNSRLHDPQSLHLILSRPIVCIMYQVSGEEVRCIAEIPADSVPSVANGEMSTFLKKSMAPQIPMKLRETFIKGINDGAKMKVVPTKSMSAMLSEKKGVIVLGDAFNMRHPVIASGMMVVLSDILILRHLLKPLDNLANVTEVSEVIKCFNDIRKPMSATVNTLGSAFSQVLVASKDEAKEAMRQGCYDYLCSGGFRTSGMMALLGASSFLWRTKATKLVDATVEERRDGGPDVIIVGAGVGGSALAYTLAKDGRRVHVIERDMREPERMMGELMQPGGRLLLSKLGLQGCLEGIDAQKATGLVLYKDGKEAPAPYPVEDNNFPYEPSGRIFYNGRFVQRLRQKASSLPSVWLEEGTVRSLIEEKGVIKGVTYKNSSGEETTAFAPLTVVCDGCYSNLRRSLNDNNAEVISYQVGYISKNCRLEDPEKLHLIMAKPSFTMLYQISSTDVRCGFELFSDNFPSIANGEMASFVKNDLAPQVPPKLRKMFLKGIEEGANIKVTPAKSMSATLSGKKGVIVLGDAFNMRHPAVASGMMVLLSDILILRRLLQPLGNLGDANKVSEVIKSFYVIRKPMSATVNTLGNAFSQVLIASTDEAKEAMRQGCYDYLSSGGFRTSGMMALLGGMNPRPLSLIYHLFAITLSSIGQLLSPFPSPLRIWHSLRLCGLSLKLLVPHLKAEGVIQMMSPTNAAAYRKSYMAATVV